MDDTTRTLAVLLVTLVFALTAITAVFIGRARRRGHEPFILRVIPAYRSIPALVGAAIEANRPIHMAFGGSELGSADTVLALASAEFFYNIAQRAAIGDAMPVLTTTAGITLPLAQDTLRRAYTVRGAMSRYRSGNVRWYPAGGRTLVYAAVLTSLQTEDTLSANVLAGGFGGELALVGAAAARHDRPFLAVSDQLDGQAAAYVFADQPLIGEEVYAAGAYLNNSASQLGALVTTDILRWLVIISMLVGLVLALIRGEA